MLVAIVAAAFVGCSKDATSDIENVISGNTVTVKFNASVEDTRATLEPNDGETAFAAAWEDGDKIGIYAYALDNDAETYTKDNVKGTRTGNEFEATFTGAPTEIASAEYCAYYPYVTASGTLFNIPFGSERTQTGNNYNSDYDIMISDKVNVDCEDGKSTTIGKDADGNAVVFPMKRQTAIAYFHFTTDDEKIKAEKVVSAKLSVNDGVNIAAETIMISYNKSDNTISLGAKTNPTNSITISFDTATAPTAADFTAWFNVLPCTFDSMTLELETENYTATILRNAGSTYEAGKLYKVSGKLTKWEPKTEDYSGTYLILAKPDSATNYYYLTSEKSGTRLSIKDSGVSEITDYNSSNDFTSANDEYVWIIEKVESSNYYTMQINNLFIRKVASNSNAIYTDESETNAEQVKIEKNNNIFHIYSTATGYADRVIAVNGGNYNYYAFYGSNTGLVKDLVLIPYVSTPKITPSVASVTVSPVAGSYEDITYTVSGFEMTPVVTATCDGAIVTAVEDADGTIKYTVSENTTGAERTGTITLSADGAESVTINVIQQSNILAAPTNLSATGTTETITAKWNAVTNATSYGWELYKGTDKETGTLVEDVTGEIATNNDVVTLTISGTFAEGEQYVLYVKSAADAPFIESAPAKSEAFTITTEQQVTTVTDVLTWQTLGLNSSNTNYNDYSDVKISSGTIYKLNASSGKGKYIQLRSKNNAGIVTTSSVGKVKAIKVTYDNGSNTLDVYGKSSAYSNVSDLYSSSASIQGTKIGSISGSGIINLSAGDYEFIGFRSNNGALYITSIEITYEK